MGAEPHIVAGSVSIHVEYTFIGNDVNATGDRRRDRLWEMHGGLQDDRKIADEMGTSIGLLKEKEHRQIGRKQKTVLVMKKKRNKRILVEVGCLIFGLLALAAVINGVFIYRSNSRNYFNMLYNQMESMLFQARKGLTEYEALPWLIGYWRDHSAELDLPGDTEARTATMSRILSENECLGLQAMTVEQVEALSEKEQRLYAEACYLAIMPQFYEVKKNFGLADITCVALLNRETAIPLFQALAEGQQTPYGNFCALGEPWPFNADLHPAIDEMYGERADRAYFEQLISTLNGVEYLIGNIPFVVNGDILCHMTASLVVSGLRQSISANTNLIEWINGALLLLSAVFLLLLIHRNILRPMSGVQQAVRRFHDDKDTGKVVHAMMSIRSQNEVGCLAHDISDLAVEMKKYSADMARMSAEKERIDTELSVAASVQMNALPNIFPAFPERNEFDIFATMHPAKEVGGDFYDFFMVDDDHLAMVVADVSGKGVPAALFMMTAKVLLKMQTQTRLNPSQVLTDINNVLFENNKDGLFVTVWLGVLTISTGELTCADAGHENLLLYQNGSWDFFQKAGAPVLGIWEPEFLQQLDENHRYRNQTIRLNPGDAIFQYTDGVTEAMDADKAQFGKERLLEAMKSAPSVEPEVLLPHVRTQIDDFVKGTPQFDDMTMLGLRYWGSGRQTLPEEQHSSNM